MPTLAELNVKIGADIANLQAGMRKAERELMKTSKTLGTIADGINRNIVAPFLLVSGAGLKMATDLGASFTKIENLVGISGKTLDDFKKGVRDISNEVGISQQGLSQALFTVTSAGLRGAEALDVLDASARASAIGLGDAEEIGRTATAVLQAYGKENITAGRAVDVLATIVREGNLEAKSLAPVLGKVVGLASQMGISFEQVGANIATFTRLGVSAEQAVDGLQSIMAQFLKPSKEAEKTLQQFGLSAQGVRDSIRQNGLAQTLIMLIEKFKGNQDALAKVIPDIAALRTVLGTAGVQGEAYIQILDSIENKTLDVGKALDKTQNDPAQKFKVALENMKNAAIDLGNIFLPMATKLAEKARDLAKWFQNLNPGVKDLIANIGLMAVVGGGALKFLSLFTGGMATGLKVLRDLLPVLKNTRLAMVGMSAINPWTAAIAAAPLLLTAIKEINKGLKTYGNTPTQGAYSGQLYRPSQDPRFQQKGKVSSSALDTGITSTTEPFYGMAAAADEANQSVSDLMKSLEALMNNTKDQVKETESLASVYKDLQKELDAARLKSQVFTDTFPVGQVQMDAYQKAIEKLLEMGYTPFGEEVQKLKGKMDELAQATTKSIAPLEAKNFQVKSMTASEREYGAEIQRSNENIQKWHESQKGGKEAKELTEVQQMMANSVQQMGDSLLQAAADGKISFKELKKAASDAARGFIRAGLAALLKHVFTELPFPASLIAAGGAIAAGIGLTALLPKAAKGAVAFGPTPIMVGDNPNARVDPEVISPLSKLREMMNGGGSQNIHVTGHLVGQGTQLLAVIDQASVQRKGIRGF